MHCLLVQQDHGLCNGDLGDFCFSHNLRDLISIRFPQHHGTVNLISGTVHSFYGFCSISFFFVCRYFRATMLMIKEGGEKVR